jgi:uncharacterized protein YegP (UPF0339 family)
MATATKKSRAAKRLASPPTTMEFVIVEDNGGAYHWTIVAGDGAAVGRSDSFATYDDAEQAAHHVRDGVVSAHFDGRAIGAGLVDLVTRRASTTVDSDAERWLDEGGSFSSEAVAKSSALR